MPAGTPSIPHWTGHYSQCNKARKTDVRIWKEKKYPISIADNIIVYK